MGHGCHDCGVPNGCICCSQCDGVQDNGDHSFPKLCSKCKSMKSPYEIDTTGSSSLTGTFTLGLKPSPTDIHYEQEQAVIKAARAYISETLDHGLKSPKARFLWNELALTVEDLDNV